ncbi:MAG: DUF5658 family protein [Candidatus Aminicenantes bacterium]
MEKKAGLDFLKAIILGVLMIAFITYSPVMASKNAINGNQAPFAEILPGTVIIDRGFTPPEPNAEVGLEEISLGNTEITPFSGMLTLYPKKVSLQSSFTSPDNLSINPIRKRNAGFTASLVSTVFLHAADYYTTVRALKYSTLQESNPFLKKIVHNQLLFGAVKLGVAGLQVTLLKGLYKKNRTLAWIVGTAMNVTLSYVVANNISKIQRAKTCYGM